MMESVWATILPAVGTAFIAGILASAVCPCTLPVGLGVIGVSSASEAQTHRAGFAIAAAFFSGIVVNLTALGFIAGQLGALATEAFGRNWALLMAFLSFLAAVVAFWWPRMPVRHLATWRRPGLMGAFSYGFIFSLGTSVAPLLLLLTVAATAATATYGILLAFVFGLGRGLPFLLTGIVASAAARFMHLARWARPLQIVSGVALVLIGGYFIRIYAALL